MRICGLLTLARARLTSSLRIRIWESFATCRKRGHSARTKRSVAQLGRVPALGAGCRGFKSHRSDGSRSEPRSGNSFSRRRKRIGPGVGVRGPISRAKRNLIKPRSGIRDCVGVGPRGRISRPYFAKASQGKRPDEPGGWGKGTGGIWCKAGCGRWKGSQRSKIDSLPCTLNLPPSA